MAEKFANYVGTALTAAITTTSQTTLTVSSVSGFPSGGNFRVLLGSELMLVTSVNAGALQFTVTRGIESTSLSTFPIGTNVDLIVTAGAILQYGVDMLQSGTYSALPSSVPQTNSTYFCTDAAVDYVSVSSTWVPFQAGQRIYTPLIASFPTQVNWSGTTTATTTYNGMIQLTDSVVSNGNHRCLFQNAPSTPYKIHARFQVTHNLTGDNSWAGLYWRNSSSGQGTMIVVRGNGNCIIYNMSNFTAPSYTAVSTDGASPQPGWMVNGCYNLVLADDGTNRTVYMNPDGFGQILIPISGFPVARATGYTTAPDEVGFGVACNSGLSNIFIQSWRQF